MKTKERILTTALKLFNETGSDHISTNHIAKSAGISIGNLYYHYKNKEEIIYAIWQEMVKESDPLWEQKSIYSLNDIKEIIDLLQNQSYKYRFFQKQISQILAKNPELKKAYKKSMDQRMQKIKELLTNMRSRGVFNSSFTDQIIDTTLTTCWIIVDFWLPFQDVSDSQSTLTISDLFFNLLNPYLDQDNTK